MDASVRLILSSERCNLVHPVGNGVEVRVEEVGVIGPASSRRTHAQDPWTAFTFAPTEAARPVARVAQLVREVPDFPGRGVIVEARRVHSAKEAVQPCPRGSPRARMRQWSCALDIERRSNRKLCPERFEVVAGKRRRCRPRAAVRFGPNPRGPGRCENGSAGVNGDATRQPTERRSNRGGNRMSEQMTWQTRSQQAG